MKKVIVLFVVCAMFFTFIAGSAKAYTMNDLYKQIGDLKTQITSLQQNLSALVLSATKLTAPVVAPVKTVVPAVTAPTIKPTITQIPKIPPIVKTTVTPALQNKAPCLATDPASITVTSPNGGETYVEGQQITVTWVSCNLPATELLYINLLEGNNILGYGAIYNNTGSKIIPLPYQLDWTQMTYGTNFLIQIGTTSLGVNNIFDNSDNLFTISGLNVPPIAGTPKIYRALISQTGTNDPTVDSVLENTTGGNITYHRIAGGGRYYLSSSNNAFTLGKTFATMGNSVLPCNTFISADMTSALVIGTMRNDNVASTQDDYCLSKTPVEVLIYP